MSSGNHDTLAYRLAQMLVKLNQGEKLEPQQLADGFGASGSSGTSSVTSRICLLPAK